MEKTYETDEIIIYWKPDICQHAAKCTNGAPDVFEVGRRPWVMPENGRAEDIAKVIDTCPSGALTYKLKEEVSNGKSSS